MRAFLFKVWGLAKPYHTRLFLGAVMGIISGLISPLLIGTVMFVYGAVFPAADSDAAQLPMRRMPEFLNDWFHAARAALESGVQTHRWTIALLIAAIPLIMLLRGLFGYLNVYFLQWVASRTVADLRVRLFAHLLRLSTGFYTENSSGQLISRVMNDTGSLQNILNNATSVIARDPISLASLLGFLLWQQPKLTLLTMVLLPLAMIPILIYSRKVRRSSREMQAQSAELTQIMSEAFTGQRVVKAYNLEDVMAEKFRETARKSVSHFMRIVRAMEIPGPLIEFFGSVGVALLLAYLISYSQLRPSPTDFLSMIGSIFLMYQPMKNLTRLQNQIVQARAATERAFALLETKNSVPEPAQPKKLQAAGADIQFDNVNFSYGEKSALQDVNLQIKSGQLAAFVGKTGSGKTTIANLLLRFYDPQQGAIRISGTDIREFSTRDLRNQIAVVTQEIILFNDTIRKNIELGRPGATNEEIISAAKHAFAHEFILEKPQGYNTIIGEKGVTLSGGQRQRIAIARAILRNAPILILDEATSALDTESERAVQVALDDLMKGRTTLCIAHRLSTILHADVIVVLDKGRVVETGKHQELIQHDGIYQKLYELQFNQ
ncbi:MAG TPA: ABC transporter ATP-binding protein [Verrucomicrobiae bacterium]|nr:ABC transporter ATP-binding protein [Verrucomicrobiae bacterium]